LLDDAIRALMALGLEKGYIGKRALGEPAFLKTQFHGWLLKTFKIFLKIPGLTEYSSEYTDTYLFGDQSGGGFELVGLDDNGKRRTFMRLYAGAGLDKESLAKLGITAEDVVDFLKRVLLEAGDKTRLDQSYLAHEGNWQYSYQVMEDMDFDSETFGLPLLCSSERIFFLAPDASWHRVLKHNFIFVEVK